MKILQRSAKIVQSLVYVPAYACACGLREMSVSLAILKNWNIVE